eukprot:6014277-Pleurochrysis_carterae.AAC.1
MRAPVTLAALAALVALAAFSDVVALNALAAMDARGGGRGAWCGVRRLKRFGRACPRVDFGGAFFGELADEC